MRAVRQLCPRCFASFEPAGESGPRCPACTRADAHYPATPARAPRALAALTPAPDATSGLARLVAWSRCERDDARAWCREHSPWWRLALWGYVAWTIVRHIGSDESYRSLFDSLNFGLHELGHELFQPFGAWLHTAGGTLTQLAAPLVGLVMFRRQGDWFAVSIALAWLATNLLGIAVYMGDARARELPLASPHAGVLSGADARGVIGHDWEYLLGHARLLHLDTTLAAGVHAAGSATMAAGLGFGAWLIACMLRASWLRPRVG